MTFDDMDVQWIHQAFSPTREIHDPNLFAGRHDEIKDGIRALLNPGGLLVIYGLRGVGKSSIAYQLKLIAEGDTVLPHSLSLHRQLPKRGFNFVVHYIHCDKYVQDTGDLLKRIIYGDDRNPSLFSLTKTGDRKLESMTRTLEANGQLSVFASKVGAKGSEQTKFSQHVSDDVVQQFRQLLGAVQKDNQSKSGLLILIDEFDIIKDKQGFSSIVKACTSDFVRFGVVGIATSVEELISDHASIGRQIDLIKVGLMHNVELIQILRKGEYKTAGAIRFDDDAAQTIAVEAEGFAYFAHLLGKEAMLAAFDTRSPRISQQNVEELKKRIAEGKLDTIYEAQFHAAVKYSDKRELLLVAFAEEKDEVIFAGNVYKQLRDMGCPNPGQYMKELTGPVKGEPVLTKVRDEHYRFTDPVFKVYARMRNWKFPSN